MSQEQALERLRAAAAAFRIARAAGLREQAEIAAELVVDAAEALDGVGTGARLTLVPREDGPGRGPRGGDAVRLASPWKWGAFGVKVGDVGVLGGMVQEDAEPYVHPTDPARSYEAGESITFRASTFHDGQVVSCSGGPGTIHTPFSELVATGETHELRVWDWAGRMPGAGKGVSRIITVPLWDWHPTE